MTNFEYETEERGFLRRFGVVIGIVLVVFAVGVVLFGKAILSGHQAPVRQDKPQEITIVRPLPPPPPPPPVERKDDDMEKQDSVDDSETKPDEVSPSSDAGITTAIEGPGDNLGLAKGKGGTGDGSGPAVRHSSSRFGWYAAQVQRSIGEELRKNKKTRTADFVVMVRIWPDSTGRIERAKLGGTTGDAGVDAALINEVLPGLQLQEPPPAGLRLPIIMRLTARRPG